MKKLPSTLNKAIKRILDIGIIFCLVMIPLIIITGGIKVDFLGIHFTASHVYTPIRILIPLLLIRMLISMAVKNFILLICSVLFSLVMMEIMLRIWDPPMASPKMAQIHRASPVLGFELVPGAFGTGGFGETYRINSAGFRDTEHDIKKTPGIYRVMVIGDSFTFGPSVNLEDTYPKQLERLLNGSDIPSEVINCGVIAYNMWKYFEMLKRKVLPYQPDLVILGIFLNDIKGSSVRRRAGESTLGKNPFEPKGGSEIMKHSHLWNYLWNLNYRFEAKYRHRRGFDYLQGIEMRKEKFGPKHPNSTWHKIMYGKLKPQVYTEFKGSLEEFVQTAQAAGSKVLVVYIPDAAQLHDTERQAVNRFVAESCAEIGIPFIDATQKLEAQKDPKRLYLFPKDAHNSPEGLRVIAESIHDKIISDRLLSEETVE